MRADASRGNCDFFKAVENKKDLFEAYKVRSTLRSMSGDIDGAVADLSSALEIKPDAELYRQRARFRLFKFMISGNSPEEIQKQIEKTLI